MIAALRGPVRLPGGLHSVHLRMESGARVVDHYHGLPTIVVTLRGTMEVWIGSERMAVPERSVQLIAPATLRSIVAGPEGAECVVVTAADDQAVGAHRHWHCAGVRLLHEEALLRIWPALEAAMVNADASSDGLEHALVTLLQLASSDSAPTPPAPWLASALAALDRASGQAGTVRDLARTLALHPVHVARVVHRHAGLTVREYLRRRKVMRAEALIRDTDWTLSQVAHAAGFADHAHLCREFGRRVGISPGEYRARVRSSRQANVAWVQAHPFPAAHFGRADRAADLDVPAIGL